MRIAVALLGGIAALTVVLWITGDPVMESNTIGARIPAAQSAEEEGTTTFHPGGDVPAPRTSAIPVDRASPTARLRVQVVDELGTPLPGRRIDVMWGGTRIAKSTNEMGRFEIDAPVLTDDDRNSSLRYWGHPSWWIFFELVNREGDESLRTPVLPYFEENRFEGMECTLRVERGWRSVEVEVLTTAQVVSAVQVHFSSTGNLLETRSWPPGRTPPDSPRFMDPTLHDRELRARNVTFEFRAEQDEFGFTLWADSQGDFVGGPLAFEAGQLPPHVQLPVTQAAAVAVRVWTHGGDVAVDQRVTLLQDSTVSSLVKVEPQRTDADGFARFRGLFAVPTRVALAVPSGGWSTYQELDLVAGDDLTVDVIRPPETPLAVAGRVLDEAGRPLPDHLVAVDLLGVASWYSGDVRTDERGAFRFEGPPCDAVLVSVNRHALGDRFAPDSQHVRHGTENVTFRREGRSPLRAFRVRAIDARTLDPLGDVIATFDRGPGTEEHSNSFAPRQQFEVPVPADTRMRVAVSGYAVAYVDLNPTLDALPPGEPLVVALEPGLHHTLRVRHADSDEPLGDVTFRGEDGRTVTSDSDGRVIFDGAVWQNYVASKPGFEDQTWEPDDSVLWAWGDVWLMPEPQDGD